MLLWLLVSLKRQSQLQQTTHFAASFSSFSILEKIRYDISWETFAGWQMNLMKYHALLFVIFEKAAKYEIGQLQIVGGASRVGTYIWLIAGFLYAAIENQTSQKKYKNFFCAVRFDWTISLDK